MLNMLIENKGKKKELIGAQELIDKNLYVVILGPSSKVFFSTIAYFLNGNT